MDRESEIQHLCKLIMNSKAEFDSCNNSRKEEHWYCPFCYNENYENDNMSNIKHNHNCEYSIAKGLMTGKI